MKVYLLTESYADGAENWDKILSVYADKVTAEKVADERNQKDGRISVFFERTFWVDEREVI